MNKMKKIYEPPKMKVYQFDNNDQILTFSGDVDDPTLDPTAEYAANALNAYMGGTNTTIEEENNN